MNPGRRSLGSWEDLAPVTAFAVSAMAFERDIIVSAVQFVSLGWPTISVPYVWGSPKCLVEQRVEFKSLTVNLGFQPREGVEQHR